MSKNYLRPKYFTMGAKSPKKTSTNENTQEMSAASVSLIIMAAAIIISLALTMMVNHMMSLRSAPDPLTVIMAINHSDIRLSVYDQWHRETKSCSSVDLKQITKKTVVRYFQTCSHADLLDTIKKNPSWVEYVPALTEEIALAAVTSDPNLIQSIKYNDWLPFWYYAVRANPDVILHLQENHKMLIANNHDDKHHYYVAYDFLYYCHEQSIELWKIAVSLKGDLYLKAPCRTSSMAISAAKQNPEIINRIESIEMQEMVRAHLAVQ